MPRYYFHVRDNTRMFRDEEGQELPDLDAARKEADADIREILVAAIRGHEELNGRRMEIVDETGSVVEVLSFRDLLK